MAARFDHLVVAVEDLDEAAARWTAAGIHATRGGRHPVGTENALVRGPGPAYVELIAAGSEESNPWLDRIRAARGPISWAIAVDDLEAARTSLTVGGFEPAPAVPGSRRTPDGDLVEWTVCDVGGGPYDDALPFLIQWTSPMPPGPADGAIVERFQLSPPDPERVADLLLALGFEPSRHWPRRVFEPAGGGVGITLEPIGEPVDLGPASWSMGWDDDERGPRATLALRTTSGELTQLTLDGVAVVAWPDRRRFPASSLVPRDGSSGASARAQAWIDALVAAGLAVSEQIDLSWSDGPNLEVRRTLRLTGPRGTQPITIQWGAHPTFGDDVVGIGVGAAPVLLERQPEWRSPGPGHEVGRIDDAFVQALTGGVYAVRDGRSLVVRSLDGWSSSGLHEPDEAAQWLADAVDGRRTEGVLAGESWV